MILNAASIIHGRTKNVDFRSGLLVRPENFSEEDALLARKYITSSTRYFEMAGSGGRRVVFPIGNTVVTGISLCFSELYKKTGRPEQYVEVDNGRTNYGFVGFAIPIRELSSPFELSYDALADEFEKYMSLRWEDEDEDCASRQSAISNYQPMDFWETQTAGDIDFSILDGKHKCVIGSDVDTAEHIAAAVTMAIPVNPTLSFCSDLPNVTSVKESRFVVVTSDNAASIKNSLEKEEQEKKIGREIPKEPVRDSFFNRGIFRSQPENSEFDIRNLIKPIAVIAGMVGSIIIIFRKKN